MQSITDIRQMTSKRKRTTAKYLSRPQLDKEVVALVGNLEYLRPGKAVDAQTIAIDEQTTGAHTHHDIDVLRVLRLVQVHAVHGQLLGILQVMHLSLSWRLSPATYNK